jgi:hypothetical protein
MRIHPREATVRSAENELREEIHRVIEKHELTEAEALRMVNAVCSGWIGWVARYAVRQERHGNTDTPGGLAPEPSSDADGGES